MADECGVKCTSTQPQRLAVRTQPMRDREVGLGVFTMCDVGHVHLRLKIEDKRPDTRHKATYLAHKRKSLFLSMRVSQ